MTFDLSLQPEMLRQLVLRRNWISGIRQLVRTAAPSRASSQCPIHPDLMKVLVCPLSKEPLRYESSTNELVCDKLGVAYPILEGGIPNLMPEDGRLFHNRTTNTTVNSAHSEPQT